MRNSCCSIASCLLLAAATAPIGRASADYSQGFDDVAGGTAALSSQGWIFRDQSSPVGATWWTPKWAIYPGFDPFPSQAGAGNLTFEGMTNLQQTTSVNAWTILPPIPGQVAGDMLSFYARGTAFWPSQYSGTAFLEVRYSPSGGTSTGSTATTIGDFTTLLKSIQPIEHAPYLPNLVSIPGGGRIAFRVVASNIPVFSSAPYLQLDTVSFNPPPPPFPIPAPGQTVTWTSAMSPIQIQSDIAIPSGGAVLIDPGVEIRIAAGRKLTIVGTIEARGTAAAPVRFTQVGGVAEIVPFPESRLALEHSIIDALIHPGNGPTIVASDCTFTSNGGIVNAFDALLDPRHTVLRLDRCIFAGSSVQLTHVMGALRDVDFQQQTMFSDVLLIGWVLLDDVSIDGTAIWLGKKKGVQPLFVDGVTVRNSAIHGGLYLFEGTDFLLGEHNVLENNLWPVEFGTGCAGLLPGSVIPTTGNINDYVADTDDFDPQSSVTWAKIAVPYVVRQDRFLGNQRLLPGVRVQFMAGLGWQADPFGLLDAQGTESNPIVFERFDAGQNWGSIELFNDSRGQRLEHCVFRGAQRAVVCGAAQLDSCRFEGCFEGIFSGEGSWALARKCEFYGNSIGVNAWNPTLPTDGALLLNGTTNPNAFVGNGIAVRASQNSIPNNAVGNWWGHASGPHHPILNPGGQGDSIETYGPLPFSPFRTAAPDFSDSPPHLTWNDGSHSIVDVGATLLFSWKAEDDSAIVSQRLLFSANGNFPSSMVPVATALSPTQRTVAFTIPSIGFQQNGANAFLRIEATDDAGQIGYDEIELAIPDTGLAGSLQFTTSLSGIYEPGDDLAIDFTTSGVSPIVSPAVYGRLLLDNDRESVSLGGGTYSLNTLPGGVQMPAVSTDRARVALYLAGSLNQTKWFFSAPFAIRPSPVLGDAPPTVTLTSPQSGESFLAGTILPIRWNATDDEELRSFDVLASTDGGRRYTCVVEGLEKTATSHDWVLPNDIAFEELRIVIVAKDKRFQNSSDESSCRVVSGAACQFNSGFGSPGGPYLAMCGAALSTGNSATLTLSNAPASQPGYLFVSTSSNPTPFLGGTLATLPIALSIPFATTPGGSLSIHPVPGGQGPFSLYLQAIVAKPNAPFGATLSNALRVDFLP